MVRQLLLLSAFFIAQSGTANGQAAKRNPLNPTEEPAAAQDPAAAPAVVIKRRHEFTDDELRKQLQLVPETGFGQVPAAMIYKLLKDEERKAVFPADLGPRQFRALTNEMRQPEQFALPWRREPDCTLGKEAAERLHVLSKHLRNCLRQSVPQDDIRPDPDKLRSLLAEDKHKAKEWKTPAAIPTLMQLLQAENTPIRAFLIEKLSAIPGKEASAALAQRSMFDLSAEVREKAVQALAARPAQEYMKILLDGMRYPWFAAADHAAEAVVALRLTLLLPDMINLLKEPAPYLPIKKTEKAYIVNEVVRINHLSNCLLCHPPSSAKDDLIRGRMPVPGEDPPPLYYNETSGLFARAGTTYLRQDFSVVQPVENNGKWPVNQRYDYTVRTRFLNAVEMRAVKELEKKGKLQSAVELRTYQQLETKGQPPERYPQRKAVLFAIQEITKADAGDSYESWAAKLPELLKDLKEEKK